MKNKVKTAGLIMILVLTGSFTLNAQRGMRGFRNDSMFVRHDSVRMQMAGRRMAMMNHDSLSKGMRVGRRMPGTRPQMRGFAGTSNGMRHRGPVMMRGMGHMPGMANGMGMHGMMNQSRPWGMMAYGNRGRDGMMGRSTEMLIRESIPNLTTKQKDELTKINEKQRDEMQKFRESQQKKFKDLREDHRKKVMDILTPEQKKWMEENAPER
ncbi:MAG: hypothetical protein ACM3NR_01005 [Methanosarcina sp.]